MNIERIIFARDGMFVFVSGQLPDLHDASLGLDGKYKRIAPHLLLAQDGNWGIGNAYATTKDSRFVSKEEVARHIPGTAGARAINIGGGKRVDDRRRGLGYRRGAFL